MSDVGIAPAPAPSAPAPSSTEVPINPNPTSAPTPLGPQAPDRPVSDLPQSRAESRRAAISKAFERSVAPAKPRMGHNNPPELMQRERTEPPKERSEPPLNLKQRPPAEDKTTPSRERGEHGHFAPRAPQQQPGQQRPQGGQQQQPHYYNPPRRMSEQAKAVWHQTPDLVRAEVHRMHKEHQKTYRQARSVIPFLNSIRPYHNMAKQHGTTLPQALHNYTGIEAKLRTDPIAGLDVIVNNLNLRTQDGRRLGLRDIAWYIVNQTPEQHQMLQQKNHQTAQSQQIAALQHYVQQLAHYNARMQYAQQFSQKRSEVDRFADAHPRLDELGDLIEQELRVGYDLPTAYRRAELLRPSTHAAQTRTQTAQTRSNSDRSIHGAPDSGPANGAGRGGRPVGRREAIAAAIKRVNGSL